MFSYHSHINTDPGCLQLPVKTEHRLHNAPITGDIAHVDIKQFSHNNIENYHALILYFHPR